MHCNGCGSDKAWKTRMVENIETCNYCDSFTVNTFDAYFKEPHFVEHLATPQHPHGQWVTSKAHKARLMREQGVREAGDRHHGAR